MIDYLALSDCLHTTPPPPPPPVWQLGFCYWITLGRDVCATSLRSTLRLSLPDRL